MSFYFAYGSNMNPARIRHRLGHLPTARAAELPGYRLCFSKRAHGPQPGEGYANIEPVSSGSVHGVLYAVTAADLKVLDGYEGVATDQYRRASVNVITADGPTEAATYIAQPGATGEDLRPSRAYLNHLLAARPYLPTDYHTALTRQPTVDQR